jgi:hypothetical protein
MRKISLGSGSGYWGEPLDLTKELAERADLDYIGLELLAELSMSILQGWKAKDPSKGYVPDLLEQLRLILPYTSKKGTKIITNGGGTNPKQAVEEIAKLIKELHLPPMKIGIIEGEDFYHQIDNMLSKGIELVNLDTGERDIRVIRDKIVAAHAYVGSELIIEALKQGADMVISGRVSDNALYVGPIMYEFGLSFEDPDWEKIGAAITIGHIIECGEAVTGGLSNFWKDNKEPWNMGMPIAEVSETLEEAIITKTPKSGGQMTVNTVKEHLVYETHDPRNYLMPDGVADLTTLKLEQVGEDRVRVTNMKGGKKRPDTLKCQIGYEESWMATSEVILAWPEAITKAKFYEQIVRERFKKYRIEPLEIRFDWIGINGAHGAVAPIPEDEDTVNEILVRCAAKFKDKSEANQARRFCMMGSLVLAPIGLTHGMPSPSRRVIGLWPTLIPREEIKLSLTMREVK